MNSSTIRRSLKSLMSTVLAIITVLLMAMPAFAMNKDVYSARTTKTINYCKYEFYSHIRFDGVSTLTPGVAIWPSITIPAGNLKGQINLYKSNGTLLVATDWITSSQDTTSSGTEFITLEPANVGSYYCNGRVKIFNGLTHVPFDTGNTSTLQIKQSDFESCPVEVNSNGEIYGSELFLTAQGVDVDLILAENSSGVTGYVRSVDLYDESPTSVNTDGSNSVSRVIPMYASDGETFVGYFEMTKGVAVNLEN